MNIIAIIIQKEFKDIIRDRRTMLTMFLIPLLLIPIMLTISGKFAEKQFRKNQEEKLTVCILQADTANRVVQQIASDTLFVLKVVQSSVEADTLVSRGKFDLALIPNLGFNDSINGGGSSELSVYFKSTEVWKKNRLQSIINNYELQISNSRLAALNISTDYIHPVKTQFIDKAVEKEKLGSTIGGFIPYIFILFCFMGCMYPAIDLFAGEKERGTIETLFTLPVTRMQILAGKLITISVAGLSSALVSMLGLFLSMKAITFIPPDLLESINSILTIRVVLLIVCMMIPFSLFMASILTMFATYARNYKEAQSSISPLTIIVILPAIFGMMPGVEYNLVNALIPIVNISLATKQIISGTLDPALFVVTLFSLIVFAGLGTWLSSKWFLKESVMMRV